MTRVTAVHVLESCLDSSVVKEMEVDRPLDEETMRSMARGGRLQYFPDFPRPYFRIDRPRAYVVQGILGETSFRVTFSPLARPEHENQLCECVAGERGAPVAFQDGELAWQK